MEIGWFKGKHIIMASKSSILFDSDNVNFYRIVVCPFTFQHFYFTIEDFKMMTEEYYLMTREGEKEYTGLFWRLPRCGV